MKIKLLLFEDLFTAKSPVNVLPMLSEICLSFHDFLKKGVTRAVTKFPEGATLFGLVKVVGCEEGLNEPVTGHYFCR